MTRATESSDLTPLAAHLPDESAARAERRRRVVIERVQPAIDGGRFPIKRTVGESITVTADIFADGHDELAGVLKYRLTGPKDPSYETADPRRAGPSDPPWSELPLEPRDNDTWTASFTVTEIGEWEYTIEAWVDRFGSWLKGLVAKFGAQQDVASELLEGAELVQQAAGRLQTSGRASSAPTPETAYMDVVDVGAELARPDRQLARPDRQLARPDRQLARPDRHLNRPDNELRLLEIADTLRGSLPQATRVATARDPELRALMDARPDRSMATTYEKTLRVVVDPVRAKFSAWYEMFPRSCTSDPARGGTFRDAEARLPRIADLGFDVLYLPPIHPIGRTHRKGRNNALTAEPGDPGSPWAIGSEDGGHTAVDPNLGTLEDFDRFVAVAHRLGLEIALDIAFQASPDHPWVREHPEWFKHRPGGSIKYAENPPKKYQDIYPFDFDSAEWATLWPALRDIFLFWISHGVKIFRVDNPHTKSFRFWEWAIAEIRRDHPDAIFLSEAFTRPKVMRYLAKLGFTQSYTYFTWRNSAHELREYLTELTTTEVREYMRPNFFANTPDILHEYLQTGGRPAFEVRLILAATLSASYGIYSGFEFCENVPVRPGSEEYLDSEKYQIRPRDWSQATLNELIARVNEIRRQHPAFQYNDGLAFHETDNPAFLWFSKRTPGPRTRPTSDFAASLSGTRSAHDEPVFVVANTDARWTQHGWVRMPMHHLALSPHAAYVVEDLLDGTCYTWRGEWNYVRLDPSERVAHIFVVRS